MRVLTRLAREDRGQSTVEYMLLISVIVIAIVAAAYIFIPSFQDGVRSLADDVKEMLDSGKIGSLGTTR
ncbi:MAG: class III signal peptide-containing protein [Deltaproteobacteria bacterium]|nr:class III signal peptide-containing protein [Deltaproteobacteria bacterium]